MFKFLILLFFNTEISSQDISIIYIPDNPMWLPELISLISNSDIKITFAYPFDFFDALEETQIKSLKKLYQEKKISFLLRLKGETILPIMIGKEFPQYSDDISRLLNETQRRSYLLWNDKLKGFFPYNGVVSTQLIKELKKNGFKYVYYMDGKIDYKVEDCHLIAIDCYNLGEIKEYFLKNLEKNDRKVCDVLFIEKNFEEPMKKIYEIYNFFKGKSKFLIPEETLQSGSYFSLPDNWENGDMLPWIGEKQENSAWQAVYTLRKEMENYKKKYNFNINTYETIFNIYAELLNQKYFYYFGDDFDSENDKALEDEFLEMLKNAYRLLDLVPPESLSYYEDTTKKYSERFQEGEDFFFITDFSEDEFNPSIYSKFNISTGTFDIQGFEVIWDTTTIQFSIFFKELQSDSILVDIYIDQNNMLDSGNKDSLLDRDFRFESLNCWEYSITSTLNEARLIQYSPQVKNNIQVIRILPVIFDTVRKTITISMDRNLLKGSPKIWKYTVVSMLSKKMIKDNIFIPERFDGSFSPLMDILDFDYDYSINKLLSRRLSMIGVADFK